MRVLTIAAAALLTALALVLSGCGTGGDGEPGGGMTADQEFDSAMLELQQELADVDTELPPWEWDADLTGVLDGLERAIDADPDHCRSLLMAAFVRLAIVAMDPDIGEILDDIFDGPESRRRGPAHGMFWFLRRPNVFGAADYVRSARQDEFPFSDVQEYIEANLIPALEYADGRLTRFEELGCVDTLYIDVGSVREIIEVEVDATDAYFLHAPIDLLQSLTHVIAAYNVDVEDGQSFEELVEEDDDFLTLRSGGHMPTAYDELLDMADHLGEATDSLDDEEAAGDPQDNDLITRLAGLIPLEDESFLGPGAVDTIRAYATRIEGGLLNGFTVNPAEDTGEPGAPDLDIEVDLAEMFNDPIDDLREYFPDHAVPWPAPDSMDVFRPVDFPDPTMSGALPTMTDQAWEVLIQWMEASR